MDYRERKVERNTDQLPPTHVQLDQTCNLDMFPHQESNQRPFGAWIDTQPPVLHHPRLFLYMDFKIKIC